METKERIANALKVATDTKVFELGQGVLSAVPSVFKELFPNRSSVIVADCNTWQAAGKRVYDLMVEAGTECGVFIFPDREFHADWQHVEAVDAVLDKTGAVAISVGSGTINDLCKLTAHHHGQSYVSVPTAASVDGYSSFGASIPT